MLDTIEGVSLLSIMEIVGPVLLALGLIYGGDGRELTQVRRFGSAA